MSELQAGPPQGEQHRWYHTAVAAGMAAVVLAVSGAGFSILRNRAQGTRPAAVAEATALLDCQLPTTLPEVQVMMDNTQGHEWGDAQVSFAFPDDPSGKQYLVGADTLPAPGAALNSSVAIELCDSTARSLLPRQNLLPVDQRNKRVWPMSVGVIDHQGKPDQALVAVKEVLMRPYEAGPYNFDITGVDLAFINQTDDKQGIAFGEYLNIDALNVPEVGPDGKHNVQYGAAMLTDTEGRLTIDAQGNVTLFGQKYVPRRDKLGRQNVGRDPYLAQFNIHTKQMRYWTGKGWSDDATNARPLFKSTATRPGMDSNWKAYIDETGALVMLSTAGPYDDTLRAHISPSGAPQGPFKVMELMDLPATGSGNSALLYEAQAHPGIKLDSDELVVSFSQTNPGVSPRRFPQCFKTIWTAIVKPVLGLKRTYEKTKLSLPPACLGSLALQERGNVMY